MHPNAAKTLIAHVETKIRDGAYTRLAGELAKDLQIPPFSSAELRNALTDSQIDFKKNWADPTDPDDSNFQVTFVPHT